MKKASLLKDYLARYAAGHPWKLEAESPKNIAQVVIIPALAEKENIFGTLTSLAANDPAVLDVTLIICVVNNKAGAHVSHRADNAETLSLLRALLRKEIPATAGEWGREMEKIAASRLRHAVIDASSPGREIPGRAGGVGMARKIGMDAALRLPSAGGDDDPPRLLMNLDADTLVEPNYLSTLLDAFSSRRAHAGVIAYEHQAAARPALQDAIILYEIYLRYWVAGLKYARSPYAFHSIGSTMATTEEAYLAVRGMNRRAAGEDFYFLNKLAKAGPVRQITGTKVYPSARVSERVPFGTGATVGEMVSLKRDAMMFYDPRVFEILRKWLELVAEAPGSSAERLLARARKISPLLAVFLAERGFVPLWTKIINNAGSSAALLKNFHQWFDGFETLKLINFLSREAFPRTGYRQALKGLFESAGAQLPGEPSNGVNPDYGDPLAALTYLRLVT